MKFELIWVHESHLIVVLEHLKRQSKLRKILKFSPIKAAICNGDLDPNNHEHLSIRPEANRGFHSRWLRINTPRHNYFHNFHYFDIDLQAHFIVVNKRRLALLADKGNEELNWLFKRKQED